MLLRIPVPRLASPLCILIFPSWFPFSAANASPVDKKRNKAGKNFLPRQMLFLFILL